MTKFALRPVTKQYTARFASGVCISDSYTIAIFKLFVAGHFQTIEENYFITRIICIVPRILFNADRITNARIL